MGTIFQELQRILADMTSDGVKRAWVSPENLKAFFQVSAHSSSHSTITGRNGAGIETSVNLHKPAGVRTSFTPVVGTMENTRSHTASIQPHSYVKPPAPSASSTIQQNDSLKDVSGMDWSTLQQAANACQACGLCRQKHLTVFEDGCRTARVMFIGEGPGEDEDRQGVPFVGRAGQLLTKMILAMGLDRTSQSSATGAYIANIVKCRPPQNRNPLPEEGNVCIAYLKRQIELVNPEVIILLGAVPLQFLLGKTGIMRLRGQWQEYNGIPVMPTFHPSYLLRCESRGPQVVAEEKRKVWQDLQLVMARLGLQRPTRA